MKGLQELNAIVDIIPKTTIKVGAGVINVDVLGIILIIDMF